MILKIKNAINLSGKMSILGVSNISENIKKAMNEGGSNFYLMQNLYLKSENFISKHFDSEDSFITNSASACIVQTINSIKNMKGLENFKVGLPVGHNIDYGANISELITWAGGTVNFLGSRNKLTINDLEKNEKIDVAFFVLSHHSVQKNHISLNNYVNYYKQKGIITIIDAAAEEDIWMLAKINPDYLIISGSKSISGPTSGFVLLNGQNIKKRKEYLEKTRNSIGRTMKIGKESIIGLVEAINSYNKKLQISKEQKDIKKWVAEFTFKGVNTSISNDSLRNIKRIRLKFNKIIIDKMIDSLSKNHIFTRNYYKNEGYIEIDLRQTNEEELIFTKKIIKETING